MSFENPPSTLKTNKGSTFRFTIIGVAGEFVGYACALLTSIFIARALGPSGRGSFALITMISSYATLLLVFGAGSSAQVQIAKREYPIHVIHSFALAFSFVVGVLGFLIFMGLKPWLLEGVLHNLDPRYCFAPIVLIPAVLYLAISNNVMVAMREIPAASKFKIFKGLRELFFMALFLICWTMGTAGAVLAWCSSVVLGALVQFVWLAMKTGWKFELNRAIVKNSLAFGTKIHFAMLPMAAVLQMDIFVLNYFWGATEVGLYAVASSLIFKFAVLFVAFESATLTRIMGDTEALAKALVRKVIRHSVIAALLFALVVGVVGRPLIIILYGAVFEKAAAVLSILTIAMLAGAVNSFLNIYVVGQLKKPELSARVNWIGFALGLICYFTLVPRFGLMGAAVAAALIRIFILVLYFFFLKWYSMSAITETFILNMSDLMALRSRFMFLRESVVSKFANEER